MVATLDDVVAELKKIKRLTKGLYGQNKTEADQISGDTE